MFKNKTMLKRFRLLNYESPTVCNWITNYFSKFS